MKTKSLPTIFLALLAVLIMVMVVDAQVNDTWCNTYGVDGCISGYVFNDINHNGIFDDSESGLPLYWVSGDKVALDDTVYHWIGQTNETGFYYFNQIAYSTEEGLTWIDSITFNYQYPNYTKSTSDYSKTVYASSKFSNLNHGLYIESSCSFLDFSSIEWYDVGGYLRIILNWLYDAPNCYLSPIWTFISDITSIIYNSFTWILNVLYNITVFIFDLFTLFIDIISLITNIFSVLFLTNSYAAITFGLILSGISLTLFLRIYNIVAGLEIAGFKLPKL